jgi:hypothetical protein
MSRGLTATIHDSKENHAYDAYLGGVHRPRASRLAQQDQQSRTTFTEDVAPILCWHLIRDQDNDYHIRWRASSPRGEMESRFARQKVFAVLELIAVARARSNASARQGRSSETSFATALSSRVLEH